MAVPRARTTVVTLVVWTVLTRAERTGDRLVEQTDGAMVAQSVVLLEDASVAYLAADLAGLKVASKVVMTAVGTAE